MKTMIYRRWYELDHGIVSSTETIAKESSKDEDWCKFRVEPDGTIAIHTKGSVYWVPPNQVLAIWGD